MFITFYYLLKGRGLHVSLNEWLTLMEALEKGLCEPSLTDFYYLCRSILVKSEVDYDKFDLAFAEYFEGIETPDEISDDIWKWLDKEIDIKRKHKGYKERDLETLQKMLEERLKEQKEIHDGGTYWVGTGGASPLGHGGRGTIGMRVGGKSHHKAALQVAGERHFRDFRTDNILDTRQFQLAFKKLRQFSSRLDIAKTELDIDETINKTCDNAGRLKLVWDRPRQNTVKLLLLFDSDGSMLPYTKLCSSLFQAVSKSSHFKDIKIYYFHNCIYEHLYSDPYCRRGHWIDTEWVFKNLSSEYKLIIIGDGAMAPSELYSKGGNNYIGLFNEIPAIDWLQRFKQKYKKNIWLNPMSKESWTYVYGAPTIEKIGEIFPMYELSIEGLETGIKKLMVAR